MIELSSGQFTLMEFLEVDTWPGGRNATCLNACPRQQISIFHSSFRDIKVRSQSKQTYLHSDLPATLSIGKSIGEEQVNIKVMSNEVKINL